ncbi:hypothetical protein [Primorskyibacter sp. S187A]|uniref:hypothetical protein n=1 Tax=Primorskyibacter sp. S187A TaxID=3415130 RepID=UPI003C7CC45A
MSTLPNRFLHRANYRRRRMGDAARLMPLAGLILLLIPLLLTLNGGDGAAEAAPRTSRVGLYIFGVWGLLVAITFGLSRGLRETRLSDTRPPLRPSAERDSETDR